MSDEQETLAEFSGLHAPLFFICMLLGFLFQVAKAGFIIGITKAKGELK